MRILLFLCLLLVGGTVAAQSGYDTGLIPKDLLPYASAIVRNEEITTEVKSLDNVIYHVKKVVTVLNNNGDSEANLVVFYDKVNSVRSIKGIIYDEYGKAIQKISESDFEDVAATDGFSLFVDDRAKHYTKAVTQYPYTIEFEYEMRAKQSFFFEGWNPSPRKGTAVEKSSYQFVCLPGFKPRYKEINLPTAADISTNKDGIKTYAWKIINLKARRYEPLSPPYLESMEPRLMIAPEKFAYRGYTGTYENWEQFGKWEYDNFIANNGQLPEQTIQHIKDLTADIADPKLKAKKIYEYMQQKTHYISVQIGIGGFRPFSASDVDVDGYGDCKGLANYTRALLKVAGVDAYYCLVYGNPEERLNINKDFASVQGNHAILCIPFKNDTTWIDCTSQTWPFGFVGDFTDDRMALACTPEGGKLIRTPMYTAEDNLEKRKADFILNDAGSITGDIETQFKGIKYDDRRYIISESHADRLKDIRKDYPINNMDIKSLDYKQEKSRMPTTFESLKLSARDYGALTNGKLYFLLNSVDRRTEYDIPKQVRNRQNPVYINRGWTEDDNISYTLPKGYKLESDPLNIHIEKPFGSFSATMTVSGDQLVYKRKLQLKDGTYSKEMYQDVVDFYQSVADADNYNVILAKN